MSTRIGNALMSAARRYKGETEWPGAQHNPRILEFFEEAGRPMSDDETPWCAAFVGAILAECGLIGTGSLAARSYAKWGEAIEPHEAAPGDVCVFWRGKRNGWQGHVAFLDRIDTSAGMVSVLGGNQGNSVSIADYPIDRLLTIRRPKPPRSSMASSRTLQAQGLSLLGKGGLLATILPFWQDAPQAVQLAMIGFGAAISIALVVTCHDRIAKWIRGIR